MAFILAESHQKEVVTQYFHSVAADKLYRLHSETRHGGKEDKTGGESLMGI